MTRETETDGRALPWPAEFLAAYEPLKCLAHGERGETLIVRGRADDGLYIAKVQRAGGPDEGAILETLSHPALPRFAARFSEHGVDVSVREYVDGQPLSEYARGRALPAEEAVRIGAQLCRVLTYLHTQTPPVIHRDIKPQNVILCADGTVKLIDFGISRTYKAGAGRDTVFSGTNDFAPPEQYGFAQTDARADIFSFGMLMRYLLTGGDGDAPVEDHRLARVIRRCTAFSPRARYGSAKRVRRALLADTPKRLRQRAAVLAAAMLLLGVFIGRAVLPAMEGRAAAARAARFGAAEEYARAGEYGFLPAELSAADPDRTVVTWRAYCAMLGSMVAAYDGTLLPEWERMTAGAPDTEMKRDGGMVSLLFAAELMGLDRFNADAPAAFHDYAPTVWEQVTMDYPVFDFMRPKRIAEDCYDNNYVGPAYDFSVRRRSNASGKTLLEFDGQGDLRLGEPFTLREAAQSVLRLYESAD